MSRRTFDGPDLETALARVRDEIGHDATIVGADRVRTGGIAGFFCRQRFEVTVEVGEEDQPPAPGAAAAGAPAAAPPVADSILALAEQVNEVEQIGLSTSGSSFSEVLARLTADSAGDDDRLGPWLGGPTRAGASFMAGARAGAGARAEAGAPPAFAAMTATAAPATAATAATTAAPAEVAPAEVAPAAAAGGGPAAGLQTALAEPLPWSWPTAERAQPPSPARSDHEGPPALSATRAAAVAAAAARAASAGAMGLDRAAHGPAPVPPAGAPAVPATALAPWSPTQPGPASLAALGVPEAYLAALDAAGDLTAGLQRAFDRLPQAPGLPVSGGAVLAVVGDGRKALALARDLAAELGLEPADVLLASPAPSPAEVPAWLCVPDAAVAAERRRSWRRRPRPVVVAVESGGTPRGQAWARHVLDALEPAAVWGVVHAGRKTEDVAAWADALGGVDALAVEDSADTTTPAAVLGVGVPVGRLDGRAATPARWAALLAERLAA